MEEKGMDGQKKKYTTASVISNRLLAEGIYEMWLKTPLAKGARPGQFIGVYPHDDSRILPRPFSICSVAEDGESLRVVYRISGDGTAEFSKYEGREPVHILGMLGNGYPIELANNKRVLLAGSGLGNAPLVELARQIKQKCPDTSIDIFARYHSCDVFLLGDLAKYGRLHVITKDGSIGEKGTLMDEIYRMKEETDLIMACASMNVLKDIKSYATEKNIPAYISLEERMACGVGACLGCMVKTKKKDEHANMNKARICTEGPVFEVQEVIL